MSQVASRTERREAARAEQKLAASVGTLTAEARAHAQRCTVTCEASEHQLALGSSEQRIAQAAGVYRAARFIGHWRVLCAVSLYADGARWHLSATPQPPTRRPTDEDAALIRQVAALAGSDPAPTVATPQVLHWVWWKAANKT